MPSPAERMSRTTWPALVSTVQVVLDIRSAGEGIAALHAMFTGLRPSRSC